MISNGIVSKASAVALTSGKVQFNDTQPDKPWYTGALPRVRRGDWVQWMTQFYVAGKTLPIWQYLSGIVQSVAQDGSMQVWVGCVPAEQTGVGYADVITLMPDQVLEHTQSDANGEPIAAKSEAYMARPIIDAPAERLGSGIWNPREEVTPRGER